MVQTAGVPRQAAGYSGSPPFLGHGDAERNSFTKRARRLPAALLKGKQQLLVRTWVLSRTCCRESGIRQEQRTVRHHQWIQVEQLLIQLTPPFERSCVSSPCRTGRCVSSSRSNRARSYTSSRDCRRPPFAGDQRLEFPGFSGDPFEAVYERLRTDDCDGALNCRTSRCIERRPRWPLLGSCRSAS